MRALLCISCLAVASCGSEATSGSSFPEDSKEIAGTGESETRGPFGVSMGQPLDSLETKATDRPELFTLAAIPKPHPDIEDVALEGFPNTGVCKVKGIGFTQQNDQTGASVRAIVDRLADQLAIKYGKPTKHDKCGGYFCNPMHWSMDVMNGERVYFYSWTATSKQPMAENVKELAVGVAATDLAQPYAIVEYIFNNEAKCKATGDRAGSKSL